MDKKTIVVTGGGTGGHLSIAKILIDNFKQRDCQVIFIGSTKGADKKWFENYLNLDKSYFLDTQGVVNKGPIGKIFSLFNIFKATLKSIIIFRKYNVSKVVSVGGFSASPASFAAFLTQKNFYIHEQNSVMGKLNTISSKWTKEVFGSYKNSTFKIDYPIDKVFFEKQRIRSEVKTVIFLGGSQGSVAINNFALKIAPILKEKNIKIIHQAGENNINKVQESYDSLGIEVDCFGFTTKLIEKLEQSDIAICRAGAGTVWELTALGIPALFVPYPYAAANHQYYNAKFIEDQNFGIVQKEDQLNVESFEQFLNSDIRSKSEGLIGIIKPNGIDIMVDTILENDGD